MLKEDNIFFVYNCQFQTN